MQIFVRSSNGSVAVQCLPTDKVEDVKCVIAERTGLKQPELAFNGRVLEDVCTLDDYLVADEATLEAYIPVLGGCVSLPFVCARHVAPSSVGFVMQHDIGCFILDPGQIGQLDNRVP